MTIGRDSQNPRTSEFMVAWPAFLTQGFWDFARPYILTINFSSAVGYIMASLGMDIEQKLF